MSIHTLMALMDLVAFLCLVASNVLLSARVRQLELSITDALKPAVTGKVYGKHLEI